MKYFYGEFSGDDFPTQDKLFGFDQMMDFIMQHGEQALKALEQMMKDPKKPEHSDLLEKLIQEFVLVGLRIAEAGDESAHLAFLFNCNLNEFALAQEGVHTRIIIGCRGNRLSRRGNHI